MPYYVTNATLSIHAESREAALEAVERLHDTEVADGVRLLAEESIEPLLNDDGTALA